MDASGSTVPANNRGKKILLVDDDQALRAVLAEQLDLYDGFTTIQVGTAAEGLEKAKLAHYDAVLLDIGLPDMDGRELCKLMRRQGVRAPVIMLTAADSDADTILGLESGANDYVTKPFRINVLLARLRAHLRQHERSATWRPAPSLSCGARMMSTGTPSGSSSVIGMLMSPMPPAMCGGISMPIASARRRVVTRTGAFWASPSRSCRARGPQDSAAITRPPWPSSSRRTTMPPRRNSAMARSTATNAVEVRE